MTTATAERRKTVAVALDVWKAAKIAATQEEVELQSWVERAITEALERRKPKRS